MTICSATMSILPADRPAGWCRNCFSEAPSSAPGPSRKECVVNGLMTSNKGVPPGTPPLHCD